MAAAVDGESDPHFWNSVGKVVSTGGSGAIDYLNGWIANFYPYIETNKNLKLRDLSEILATMKKLDSDKISHKDKVKHFGKMPAYDSIPIGLTETPFIWEYVGTEIPMQFVSGFIGTEQTADGYLKPQIGWAIAEKKAKGKKK